MPWTETTRPQYERRCPRYASDLTDEEWALLEPMMPGSNRIGRPRKTELREIVNALLYMASSGGAWRLLPKDFPHSPRAEIFLPLARRGPAARNQQ